MKKLTVCVLVFLIISAQLLSAFALDENRLITDVYRCSGSLYLSDWKSGSVVLKDVKPLTEGDSAAAAAGQLEYTEIPAFDGNIRSGATGEELDLSSLAWFLDMEVEVTVASLAGGELRIISVVTK